MKSFIIAIAAQLFFLLLYIKRDINDGEKELFKCQHWKITHILIVIFAPYFVTIIYYVTYWWSASIWIHIKPVRLFLMYPGFISLCILSLAGFNFRQNLKNLGFKNYKFLKALGLGISFAFFIYLPHFFINQGENDFTDILKILSNAEKPLFLGLVIIVSPIIEEVIFRGILYSPYRKKYGPTTAIFINSFQFLFLHFGFGMHPSIIAPFVFCKLYEETESIYPSIVAHCCYNSFGVMAGLNIIK